MSDIKQDNLICSQCGSGAVPIEKDGIWRCPHCGSRRPSPHEIPSDLKISLNLANNRRENGHFSEALEIYESILAKEPKLEEANWGALVSEYGIEFVEENGIYKPTVHRVNKIPVNKMPYYEKLSDEYKQKADSIEKVRASVWEKVEKIEPYDVFICYKQTDDETGKDTTESKWARDLYYSLTHQFGLKVFYAPIVIAKSNNEWEPQIYAALQSARLMVVLATSTEHVNAPWVKNEWSRFAKFAKKDSKEKVIRVMLSGMDPAVLPAELRNRQVFDRDQMWEDSFFSSVSELFNSIPKMERKSYSETKIGKKTAVQQTITKRAFNTYSGTASISEATEIENARKLCLELKKFDLTIKMCNNIIEKNNACHEAYLIKLLAENRCTNENEFTRTQGINKIETFEAAFATGNQNQRYALIRLLHDKIKNTNDFGLYKEFITFPEVNESEYSDLREAFFASSVANLNTNLFDGVIKTVSNVNDFLRMHLAMIDALERNNASKNAQIIAKYLKAYLDHDEGNHSIIWKSYCLDHKLYDFKTMSSYVISLNDYSELEGLYAYGYNEEASAELFRVCCQNVSLKTEASTKLCDFLLKLIPENYNASFISAINTFIDVLFQSEKYDEISKYNDQLLAMDEMDHWAHFNRLLIKYKTNNLYFFISMYDKLLLDEHFNAAINVYSICYPNRENIYRNFYVELQYAAKDVAEITRKKNVSKAVFGVMKKYTWPRKNISQRPGLSYEYAADKQQIKQKSKTATKIITGAIGVLLALTLIAFGLIKFEQWRTGAIYELSEDGTYYICTGANVQGIVGPKKLTIKSTYNDLPVKEISANSDDKYANCEWGYAKEIIIPSSVSIIIPEHLDSGRDYIVDNNNEHYKSIEGSIYTKDGTTLVQFGSTESNVNLIVPDGVTSIGKFAFKQCSNLTSITFSDSVTSIGESAFYECSGLKSITIPDRVTSIENNAFAYCYNLVDVTIPNSVTSIGENAFYWCGKIENLTIGNGVTSIGSYAFYKCQSLTSVTIPGSVREYGEYIFRECINLKNVTLSTGLTTIGKGMFYDCGALRSIVIPDGVTTIGEEAFDSFSMHYVVMPTSVTSIGKGAFDYVSYLYYTGTKEQWKSTHVGSNNYFNLTEYNYVPKN